MLKEVHICKETLERISEKTQSHIKRYHPLLDIPANMRFGIEIEFISPYSVAEIQDYAGNVSYEIRYDGMTLTSVKEAISPILTNKKETWQELKNILNLLKKEKAYADERTGAHIHFDNLVISDKNIINFLKMWYIFEDLIYKFSYGEFDHLRCDAFLYATKLNDELKECIDSYESGEEDLTVFSKFDKGYGINLSNHLSKVPIHYKNTYEIRCPNGTVDLQIWQNNINFFAHLLLFSENEKNKELINAFYKNGKLENNSENAIVLSELIFNNEEDKLDFLKQYHLVAIEENTKEKTL